jgi:replicative DNA helicase
MSYQNKTEHLQLPDEIIELLFLNKILTSETYTTAFLEVFDSRWMQNKIGANIVNVTLAYFKKIKKLPSIQILRQLLIKIAERNSTEPKEYFDYLDQSFKTNISDDEQLVQEGILDFAKRRGLYFKIFDNIDRIEKKKDVSSIVNDFASILNISIDQDLGLNYFKHIKQHIEIINTTDSRFPTGIPEFDNEFNGGLLRNGKCIWVPVGMPGIGKTMLLTNIAHRQLKLNKKVLVITCELERDLYAQRIDALNLDVEINAIPTKAQQLIKHVDELQIKNPQAGLVIKELPPRTVNCLFIENYINKLILSGFKPDIILIDYLNLIRPNGESADSGMYERVGATCLDIRALTYRFNVPIVAPTQFSTEGFDNSSPSMAHIAESRAVAHHADAITAVFQGPGDRESNVITFRNLKNRLGGRIGKSFQLRINYDTLKLSSISNTQQQNKNINSVVSELENI